MTANTTFNCIECCDTYRIDSAGSEIACPYCQPITLKISGLSHGLGQAGGRYITALSYTRTCIVFVGTREAILSDVTYFRRLDESYARSKGIKGRNGITSGSIAIERKVRAALAR